MFIFFINLSVQVYIRHYNDDLYISGPEQGPFQRPVEPSFITKRTDFYIDQERDGEVYIRPIDSSSVWSVNNDWTLTYSNKKGGPNQLFSLTMIAPKLFHITNMGKCVEYRHHDKKYVLTDCSSIDTQKFIIFSKGEELIDSYIHNNLLDLVGLSKADKLLTLDELLQNKIPRARDLLAMRRLSEIY
ncbi:hypothetical protein NCER_100576 [Vairimorpha ceranae BRL01]|uniref:Uncharacterized protein n=2 Tax=Vairimorpha ceranae TaxID=40302 RepID=C4V7Y0_VAIC1|nr:hypothetical protein AAJ76_1000016205 [Vairimorpha ceranae]EEQ82669.1 hypothetical protein NCER_100576 [Vairimorpha ceranae BRL01]KAF5141548.1 hypothetical protein G9O61_00g002870 [Vairimorpha ceranae]KKO75864.1 hypothetical protein AAJ76_1000016205 [Vairimorpha ceranae]